MRVVFCISSYHPDYGGSENFACAIAGRLAREGHEVTVLTRAVTGAVPEETFEGVRVRRVGRPVTRDEATSSVAPHARFVPLAARELRRMAREEKPDLVHGVSMAAGLAILAAGGGVPHVMTVQGGDLAEYGGSRLLNNPLLRAAVRSYLRKARAVHVVSEDLAAQARALGVRDPVLVPNGLELDRFARPAGRPPPEPGVVVSVSRLVEKNGLADLLRAFARLPPDLARRLDVVGSGPLEAELRALAADLKLGDRVRFEGSLGHDEVPARLWDASLFARTSLQEGFGIAFIEAMAAGVPVLGTRTGGIPDIVKDGENGLLAEPGDVDGIARALRRLLEDPALAARLSERGLRDARDRFGWDPQHARLKETIYAPWLRA